jgi:hypothetical protein
MIAKKIKSAMVAKSDAINYLKRARELLASMRNNLAVSQWSAAVIDGIHAAISANDALTVVYSGQRCTSSHHVDAVEFLKQSLPKNFAPDLQRLKRVISIKSHVEYGPSLTTEKEAHKVAQDVERFIAWAEGAFKCER